MNPSLMGNHKNIVSACKLSSFYATSARKPDDGRQCPSAPTHALSANYKSAALPAIDFDAVKNAYYNEGTNVPCSVDAATIERDGLYLVEFKCGDADQAQLFRKIYDSVMLLIEYDSYSFVKARNEIYYIVVSAKLQPWSAMMRSLSRACGFCKEPWRAYRKQYDHWCLAPLDGVVVRAAYTMPPDMFDYFVKYKKWK